MQVLANGIVQGILFALMGIDFSLAYSTQYNRSVWCLVVFPLSPIIMMINLLLWFERGYSLVTTSSINAIRGNICYANTLESFQLERLHSQRHEPDGNFHFAQSRTTF